jgi:hypothetical protein
MKKGLLIVLLVISSFFACQTGCKDQFDLKNYVSYYQSNVYVGDYNGIKITAYYGQSEQPYKSDGIKGDLLPFLTFKMSVTDINADYHVTITTDKEYQSAFTFEPIKSHLTATLPVKNVDAYTFDATVTVKNEPTTVKFTSIVNSGIIGIDKALSSLYTNQQSYIDSLIDGDDFNGEIIVKLTVVKEKPYYYVGIADKNNNYKALLIDGISAEVLAIRNVY